MPIQLSFLSTLVLAPAPKAFRITDNEKKIFISFSDKKLLEAQGSAKASGDDFSKALANGQASVYQDFKDLLSRENDKEKIFQSLVAGFYQARDAAREQLKKRKGLNDEDSKNKALVENYKYGGQAFAYAELLREFAKVYPKDFKDKLPKDLPVPFTIEVPGH